MNIIQHPDILSLTLSLFVFSVLHSINAQAYIRFVYAWITRKPIEQVITKSYKALDCTPCFSFWVSLTTTLVIFAITKDFHYLTPLITFVLIYNFSNK